MLDLSEKYEERPQRGSATYALGMAIFALAVIAATVALLGTSYYYLAPAPGLVLLFVLSMDKWPSVGYYIIVFVIPFGAYRSPGTLGGYLRIHWVLGITLVVLAFLHWLPRKAIARELKSKIWIWFLLFLGIRCIAALLSNYPGLAWKHVALLVAAATFVAVTIIFVGEHGFMRTLPAVIVISVTASATLSVLGYFWTIPWFAHKAQSGLLKRGTGAAPDPNNLSLMIVFALPFLVHYIIHTRHRIGKLAAVALVGINLMALVTTYSRGGALMFGVMLVGLLLHYRRTIRPAYLGLVVGVLALGALFVVSLAPESYWDRLRSLARADDMAMARRASYVVVAVDKFAEHPIIGHGPGSYPQLYSQTEYAERFSQPHRPETKLRHAHNTYLDVLIGSGLLGLVAFAGIILYGLRSFWIARMRAIAASSRELASLIGTYQLSFIIVLLYLVIFSDPYHKHLLVSLGASQVALCLTARMNRPEE